jgi:uncharacterized membrane protein YdjX (TVP38/TMEM64 family)
MNRLENGYTPPLKLILVVLVLAPLLWLSHPYLFEWLEFFRDRAAVEAYLASVGVWGPLLYLLILAVQVLTVVIPGHILMITAGYLYGFDVGLGLNLVGVVGTSQIAFVLSRWTGKPLVQRLVPDPLLERWQAVAERQGFFFYLFCFWFPIIPGNVTNYLGGLSSISFWGFFLANLLGRLPGLVIITLIGAYSLHFSWQQWVLIALLGLISIIGGRFLTTKLAARFSSSG